MRYTTPLLLLSTAIRVCLCHRACHTRFFQQQPPSRRSQRAFVCSATTKQTARHVPHFAAFQRIQRNTSHSSSLFHPSLSLFLALIYPNVKSAFEKLRSSEYYRPSPHSYRVPPPPPPPLLRVHRLYDKESYVRVASCNIHLRGALLRI